MAVLTAWGFDAGGPNTAVAGDPEGGSWSLTGGTLSRDATIRHGSSGSSAKLVASATGQAMQANSPTGPTAVSGTDYFGQVWLYFPSGSLPGAESAVVTFGFSISTRRITVSVNAAGDVKAYGAGTTGLTGTLLGTLSGACTVATWHKVSFRFRLGNGTSTDQVEVRFNDVAVGSSSALGTGAATVVSLRAGWLDTVASNASKTLHLDDLVLADTGGSGLVTWPGDVRVNLLSPTSDNARTGTVLWTGAAGGTTNLFDATNNRPPIGVDVISATNLTQNHQAGGGAGVFDANCATYSTLSGLAATTDVLALKVLASMGPEVTTGTKLVRAEGVSGPVIASTADISVGTVAITTWPTGWVPIATAFSTAQPATLATSPVIRVNRAEVATRAVACSFMAMQVIWQAVAAAPKSLVPRRPNRSYVRR